MANAARRCPVIFAIFTDGREVALRDRGVEGSFVLGHKTNFIREQV